MPDTAIGQRPPRSATRAGIGDILDETQSHLILRWDAWRSGRGFGGIGLSSLYCLVAMFFLVFFAAESMALGETGHAALLGGFAVLTLACLVYLRRSRNTRATNACIVLLLGGLCLFLLVTGGITGTGPMWFFVFPLVALFIQASAPAGAARNSW